MLLGNRVDGLLGLVQIAQSDLDPDVFQDVR
jgi:hypothetical protein